MSDIRIGAIWNIGSVDASRIHPDIKKALDVTISDDGKWWSVHYIGQSFGVGDTMKGPLSLTNAMGGIQWEALRKLIAANKLGHPDQGVYPVTIKTKAICVCTCDTMIIMNHGCPSNRGERCPDRRWSREMY